MKTSNLTGNHSAVKLTNNFQFTIYNLQFSIPSLFALRPLLLALCTLLLALCPSVQAQTVADKTVASVTNGSRAMPDLITYSDLIWQLALEPATPFAEKPSSENLNRALRELEDQVLVLQEARKLPSADTPEGRKDRDEEVKKRRDELAQFMGSAARLQERMTRVGLTSEQLDWILRDRVMVDKYFDFRFRAFVVIPDKELTDRYNETFGHERNSGRIVPTFEEVRSRIYEELRNAKITDAIDAFVDNLREQPGTEIVVLSPVGERQ
ncbi:MAG TPA: hypothetical protein VLQ90_01520 [Pyrinomonadaceae bacterium]|nr:hypothetical protein [Pyrinomonadaceae bacterium]